MRNIVLNNRLLISATSLFVAAILLTLPALSAPLHQHGVAKLNITFDSSVLNIEFDTPLEALLGFERAPRTGAERKSVELMVAALNNSDDVFRIDPTAKCVKSAVEITSAPLKLGRIDSTASSADSHGDLIANFRFECSGTQPTFVEVNLFNAFERLSRIEAQAFVGTRPAKGVLTAASRRFALDRR